MGDDESKPNVCFPVRKLENDRLKLIPFKIEAHAQLAYDQGTTDPFAYAQETEGAFLYAIIDKTKPSSVEDPDGAMARIVSFTEGNVEARAVEIGTVRIFPSHQDTGLATLAAKILLDYAFAAPEEGGLGLLRVEWHSNTENAASIATAHKLGFEMIGAVKYESCLADGKARGKIGNGKPLPRWCKAGDVFRDLAMYAMYWDSWGAKDKL
ncbi:acetyltransferase [Zalerion maritima]|uniref:Acetyltransferase n=1 Tax=Zalerion maritima TaxID=339359 RepID=A0AAD5WQU9_9PEZI|nr:acetyltransferase [Zalerion maritima]